MTLELQIISQQLKLLEDRPDEIRKAYELVHRQVEKSTGLSEKEYKKRLEQTKKRLERTKHFK